VNRLRAWLRVWLGIERLSNSLALIVPAATVTAMQQERQHFEKQIHLLQNEIRELRAEVTRLQIAQYVPPSQPEPEKKVIRTQTFKQFTDILEREQETSDAL